MKLSQHLGTLILVVATNPDSNLQIFSAVRACHFDYRWRKREVVSRIIYTLLMFACYCFVCSGEKPFTCKETGCGKSLATHFSLKSHHKRHELLKRCGCQSSADGKLRKHKCNKVLDVII